jgi:hypothetical protein
MITRIYQSSSGHNVIGEDGYRSILLRFDSPHTIQSIRALQPSDVLDQTIVLDVNYRKGILLHYSQSSLLSDSAPIFQTTNPRDAAQFILDQLAIHSIHST